VRAGRGAQEPAALLPFGWNWSTERVVVLELVGAVAIVALVVFAIVTAVSSGAPPREGEVVPASTRPVSDRHRHRWTRWQILEERRIHLYGEVDEGRDLPDRIDVVLRRECARCGLPQTKTVRGLDADRHD